MADQSKTLFDCAEFFEGIRVFVTSREKIKHPEGTGLFDEFCRKLREAAGEVEHKERAALSHAAGQDVDKGPWEAEIVAGKVVICSDDFAHDVWLYVTGDFENNDEALAYAGHLADKLNSPAVARSEGSD